MPAAIKHVDSSHITFLNRFSLTLQSVVSIFSVKNTLGMLVLKNCYFVYLLLYYLLCIDRIQSNVLFIHLSNDKITNKCMCCGEKNIYYPNHVGGALNKIYGRCLDLLIIWLRCCFSRFKEC